MCRPRACADRNNSSQEAAVAIDTLLVVVGVYDDVADAKADYERVGDLHTEAGLIDAYDAAVIERTDKGKTRIVKKHETPTRVGGVLGGGMGLATGWSLRCSHLPPSVAGCLRAPPPEARSWAQSPVTPRRV